MRYVSFSTLALVLFTLNACGEEPASRAEVTAAGDNEVVARTTAVKSMAATICDHERDCNGFGDNRDYASYDACKGDQEQKWSDRWNDTNCVQSGHGPVAGKVRACQQIASNTKCGGNIIDQAAEWAECRGGAVCR